MSSGADALRTQSQSIPGDRPPDPEPEESIGTESMADDEEQEAKLVLHAGLEHAAAQRENAIEAYAASTAAIAAANVAEIVDAGRSHARARACRGGEWSQRS